MQLTKISIPILGLKYLSRTNVRFSGSTRVNRGLPSVLRFSLPARIFSRFMVLRIEMILFELEPAYNQTTAMEDNIQQLTCKLCEVLNSHQWALIQEVVKNSSFDTKTCSSL